MKSNLDVTAERPDKSLLTSAGFRAWIISVAGILLLFGFQGYYPALIGPLSNVLPAATAGSAFLSSLLCFKKYGFSIRKQFEAVWFFFSLGTGLWVLAEVSWAYYYFALQIAIPYPSIADIFYVSGYLPILVALSLYLKTFSGGMSRGRMAASILSIVCAASAAMYFVLPIEFAKAEPAVTLFTDLLYPVLDLVLLSLAILCLAIFVGGSIAKWWAIFGGAIALYVVGDEYFLYKVATGTYYNGGFDDAIFLVAYMTLALAFYVHRREL